MTTPSTPTSTMKEAERLVTEFARVCRLAPTGVVPGIEGDHLEQCAKDALLAFIRSLVEAQPCAVAGEAVPWRESWLAKSYERFLRETKGMTDEAQIAAEVDDFGKLKINAPSVPAAPSAVLPLKGEVPTGMCMPEGLMTDSLGNPRVRYVRVTYDGRSCVVSPTEADSIKTDLIADRYEFKDVYLSEQEHDALPEFDGF